MSIPINPVTPRIQYTATASQTVFNVPFPFFENTDLSVYLTEAGTIGNDAADILTYSTDYTVSGAGNANGGSVTLNSGAAVGDIITIVRSMSEERLSLYLPGGLFTADQVNDDFSMDVMMIQQNNMLNSTLTPHYQYSSLSDPDIDNSVNVNLPLLGAGQCWVMNDSVTQIEAVDFSSGGGGGGGGGGTWVATSVSLTIDAGTYYYTTSPGGALVLTLPTSCPAGTIIRVAGFTATSWQIAQNSGQRIFFGAQATTSGTGGSISSTNARDAVEMVCVVANTSFLVLSSVGNITFV